MACMSNGLDSWSLQQRQWWRARQDCLDVLNVKYASSSRLAVKMQRGVLMGMGFKKDAQAQMF